VYLCTATEDELTIKEASLNSKIIRTEGLRLVPSDIQEEALEQCYATQRNADAEDPKAAIRRVIDAFAGIGVMPEALEKFFGHSVDQVQPKELITLRQMYQAISEGEATWASFTVQPETEEPPASKGPAPSIKDRAAATTGVQFDREAAIKTVKTLMDGMKSSPIKAAMEASGLVYEDDPPPEMQSDAVLVKLIAELTARTSAKK
jgi:hypothetical protein